MSEEPRPLDDPFLPLLVAFDEDLAAGRETPPAVPPEWTERFEAARSVLQLLERAWPRGGAGDTTVDLPQAPAEGAAGEGTDRPAWENLRSSASWAAAASASSIWPATRNWDGAWP